MPGRLLRRNPLLTIALAFLCLHAVSLLVFRSHSTAATYPFMILAPLLALSACIWRTRSTPAPARLPWILLSIGLLLWNCGIWLSAWEELLQNTPFNLAFYSDFVFFLYGVPVLLAISSPAQDRRIPLFVWLDAIQALLTAYLTYIILFAVIPFTTTTIHPISSSLLMQTYNVENLILAVAATLRLVAQPEQNEDRRFLKTLCIFLWSYAIGAGVYNYGSILTQGHTLYDLLVDLPFFLLFLTIALPAAVKQEGAETAPQKSLALLLDNTGPIFYTLALSMLGIAIVRSRFFIGVAAVLIAIAVYGIRTITLQTRYLQSQRALQDASRRLEEISLKDGLTNVANRRCFDQMLEAQWHRATRTQHPLSLLLIDIDHFKNLNDRWGHQYGDQCLVEVARALQLALPRSGDLLARYGGEEFVAILPATDNNGAAFVANRMQTAVRSLNLPNETSVGHFVTVSIGIALYEFPQAGSPASLIEAADQALYKAKQNGRNRSEHAPMQPALDAG